MTELDKIAREWQIKEKDISENCLYTGNTKHVRSKKALLRSLGSLEKYNCYYIFDDFTKNYRRKIKLTDDLVKKIKLKDTTTLCGYFTIDTIKSMLPIKLYPLDLTDELQDNIEFLCDNGLLTYVKYKTCNLNEKTIKCLYNKWARNNAVVMNQLFENPNIDPEYLINLLCIDKLSFLRTTYATHVLVNPKFQLDKYVDDMLKIIKDRFQNINDYNIIDIIQAKSCNDEIFIKCMNNVNKSKYFTQLRYNNIYETLSSDVILKYLDQKYLNPVLMYMCHKQDIKTNDYLYSAWYKYYQMRDSFIEQLRNKKIPTNYNLMCNYCAYVVKHIQLTKKNICYVIDKNDLLGRMEYIYMNPTLTPELIDHYYETTKDKYYGRFFNWCKCKHIDTNTIIKLLYKHKNKINNNVYARTDLPINVLIYIVGTPNNRICKNIYITNDILLKYNIKPCAHYLRSNLMHLDPRYVKQPSYTVEI